MPTLEERVEALERALVIMREEHVSDIRQLDERIRALRQQITEQGKRLTAHEQGFEKLITVLTQQFGAINTHIDARFEALNTSLQQSFASIDARFEQIRQQFTETNMALTAVTATVGRQGQDIRSLKEDVHTQGEKLNQILERLP